ncbi:hypothetical protein [Streptomyces sp. NPDC059552]|uniref:hypothetical protein n=1 Tax=Streptomyces sp. NPDC059552 TaxID=3346862 RepID=UPI00369B8CE4
MDELAGRGLLPAEITAAFLVGSRARGWDSSTSDVDIYLVSPHGWESPSSSNDHLPLDPPEVQAESFVVDGTPWEVRYWRESQVSQMLEKVSWERFDAGSAVGRLLNQYEEKFIDRLFTCVPVTGTEWVAEQKEIVESSAFRSFLVADSLNIADDYVEDALGQLASGDVESALLATRLAFGGSVDAVLASAGEYGRVPKWRARRFRSIHSELLSFDEYWSIETMRTFEERSPHKWVLDVLHLCKRISIEVDV